MNYLSTAVLFLLLSLNSHATTIVVVNTNDAGAGSLRDAISNSNNYDTIRFDPNIIAVASDTIKLASTISINKNLVIIGLYNGSTALYISGENSFQIFNADLSSVSVKDLTLDSLRFIKANSSISGGAVKFKGFHLNVSNSIFSNNTATTGAAISSQESYGIVNVNACSFILNSAPPGGGGAIYSGGNVILVNSDCSNNNATSGGAIYSVRKLTIDNSTFVNNTALDKGGAVTLSSNTATSSYPILVTNSTFENNSANFGGAIYTHFSNTEVNLTINNSTFDSNHSVWAGGAVYASSNWYKSTIDINDSRIINNTSDDDGAGVHCKTVHEKASVLVDSCWVENNVAAGTGGGISALTTTDISSPADTAFLHITNSTIVNNSASKGGGLGCSGTGGAFGSGVIIVDNSIISNNIATTEGGGIYNFASASNDLGSYPAKTYTTINYSTINNNQAGENGGGVYSHSFSAGSSGASQSFVFVNQSTLVNNTAVDDGGAIGSYSRNDGFFTFGAGVSVDVKNSTIYNNYATYGGAVYSRYSSYSGASNVGAMAAQFTSSIIAFNGSNDIYAADSIVSLGYNIFSGDSIAVPGSIATDQMQVDSIALSLGVLQLNGGFTPTILPSLTSPAINSGSPSDGTDAQNVPVLGIREVGSAEYIAVMNVVECDSFVSPSGNITYYTSGFYVDTIVVGAADSLVYINLSINTSFSTLTDSICAGDTYTSPNGDIYTVSSNFIDTIPNHLSCDSIISISLTVFNQSSSSIDTIACASYTSPSGIVYAIAGLYNDTILNVGGCDSVITINLSFGNTSSSILETACYQYTSPSGNIYNSSGNYIDTISNAVGCDSIITLDLTILNPSTETDLQTACDSYTWIDGNIYTTSNNSAIHTYSGAAANGCDSIVTLDLTILNSSVGTDSQTACTSFTWIDGTTYATTTNTPTYTLTNAAGCDSIVTLDLTINTSNSGTDVQTACDTYDWIDGNTYISTNNSAQWTLTNAAGCDSIVTLDLTINYSSSGIDVQSSCDTYDWIDGNTYTSTNNSAQWTLTNAAGCDSIVTLDLTINYSNSGTDVQSACDTYDWIDGNTYTSTNNTAQWTLTNAAGCDSIVTLNLTIGTVEIGTTQIDDLTIEANATGVAYQWLDCNNSFAIISGETSQTYAATANGNYAVEITQGACIDTSACVAITTIGILENDFDTALTLYPNPTTGSISITFGEQYSDLNLQVSNVMGQLVFSRNFGTADRVDFELEGPTGLYFIDIVTGEGKTAKLRVIKK